MNEGCKICDEFKEHYYFEHMNGSRIEFYEFMHGSFEQHVRIPSNFAKFFRCKLHETIDLKSPISGKTWPARLKETDGGVIVLQSGWEEFVEAHDIRESYFVVFKYDNEKSCFDISIYDETRCKKRACSYLPIMQERVP